MEDTMESENKTKSKTVYTKQVQIAKNAKRLPEVSFTSLSYHMDIAWMYEAYLQTRKDGAVGVDGVTAKEYEKNLGKNLKALLERAKSGKYRAPAVKRVYISKGDSKEMRPLGIPTFEDKILQRAVKMLIEPIYEQDFYGFSYGFRPGKSQHQALNNLRNEIMSKKGWIIDLDIRKYFDSIDHRKLREVIKQRVRDGVITRLIGKWLNAGIMEKRNLYYTDSGTPQGGVISPLLSNIYLHEVLDKWFVKEVKPRMEGEVFLIRFADDAVIGFKRKEDANKVMRVLGKRFAKYGLKIHPEKTKMIRFDRSKESETFDFLGFTHYWGKSRKGYIVVMKKTAKDRLRKSIKKINTWCKENRHESVNEQFKNLNKKLIGHYGYYGITCNYRSISQFYRAVRRIWYKWLDRRTDKSHMNWGKFKNLLNAYPLSKPRIVHSVFAAKH
jgi:RNA-directed DNA polymerase